MKKYALAALTLITCSAHAMYSEPEDWEETFKTKAGLTVSRTSAWVNLGGMLQGKQLNLNTLELNGFALKGFIKIGISQTRAEFVQALVACGLIDPVKDAEVKAPAKPVADWNMTFLLSNLQEIERTSKGIQIGDTVCQSFIMGDGDHVLGIKLTGPLSLSMELTQDAFKKALMNCGLIIQKK